MIGADGTFTNLNYLNPTEVHWSLRFKFAWRVSLLQSSLSRKAVHRCDLSVFRNPGVIPPNAQSETQTQHRLAFLYALSEAHFLLLLVGRSAALQRHLSLPCRPTRSWSPAVTASMGGKGATPILRPATRELITGGGGLVGAFQSKSAAASARWQLARTWNVGSASELLRSTRM